MAISAPERETVITGNDEDRTYHVWTAERSVVTAMKKKADRFEWYRLEDVDGSEVFVGVVSRKNYSPVSGFKPQMSEERRKALSEKMKAVRAS